MALLRCSQSAAFLWLKSGIPFLEVPGGTLSPEKRNLPASTASPICISEASSKPHLFLGPSCRQDSAVSQSTPLWGSEDGAMGQIKALIQLRPKTSSKFCFHPRL